MLENKPVELQGRQRRCCTPSDCGACRSSNEKLYLCLFSLVLKIPALKVSWEKIMNGFYEVFMNNFESMKHSVFPH